MEEPKKSINWFTRILILLIGGLIAGMIVYKYFSIDPKAEISSGIIILLAFLILLVLSEVFDNFSIGEIIKLSRTVKEKEKEIDKKDKEVAKVETEKQQLLSQVISLSNNFSQRQSNTNIYGWTPEGLSQVSIQKAEPKEVEELKKKEAQEQETENTIRERPKKLDMKKVEELALRKFITENNIDISKLFREVKLQAFQGIDPISDNSPIFDAYLNEFDKEVFFEFRTNRGFLGSMFMDKLYLMLSKIFHYRNIKKTNVYLNVIMIEFVSEGTEDSRHFNRLLDYFQPALNNNLLRLSTVKIDQTEMEALYEA